MDTFKKIINFFTNPMVAVIIMFLFLLTFFLAQGLTTGLGYNFLSFGPTKDEKGRYTVFMGITLKAWKDVVLAYFIIFISTFFQIYYNNTVSNNLQSYAFNPAVKIIPFSKFWTYFVLLVDPLISIMLYVIRFHATATLQLQYIIPQILGSILINLPFILNWLCCKKFIHTSIF